MAKTKVLPLVLLALLVFSMLATEAMARKHRRRNRYGPGTVKPYQCLARCKQRCSNTQYYNNCMLFCQKCCRKCLCVPPGTYGNKQVCPCYNNWKTKEGGPKCP